MTRGDPLKDAAWMDRAACRGMPVNAFFPSSNESNSEPSIEAITTCRRCPVRQQCLDYAMVGGEKHGIWGGTTERERRKLLRQRVRARTKAAS